VGRRQRCLGAAAVRTASRARAARPRRAAIRAGRHEPRLLRGGGALARDAGAGISDKTREGSCTVTLSPELELLGHDLEVAVRRLIARRRRRRRMLRIGGATFALAVTFTAVAVASGIGPDLQLDPTKWTILHRGLVDN